ncbi:complement factor I-like isoform X1 [Clupea harengus]|uniref:trypsin n=1 Tax=Clupea harengus TaxID=7950 RepID=A0A6P8GTG1_CLUHA|nr:complement factor I-like isoform X1 [Clupea harengus]XP_031441166.1 complement factor I-like isoform X1 [Clupea harengus]
MPVCWCVMDTKARMKLHMGTTLLVLLLTQNTHLLPSDGSGAQVKTSPADQPSPGSHLDLECREKGYTHMSCSKVSCPEGLRCIPNDPDCTCNVANKCPPGKEVCGHDRRMYRNRCQAVAATCRDSSNTPVFSHLGTNCTDSVFRTSLKTDKQVIQVWLPNNSTSALICHTGRNIAAVNVLCRQMNRNWAESADYVKYSDVPRENVDLPDECVHVFCKGHEYSLAECKMYHPKKLKPDSRITMAKCYSGNSDSQAQNTCEFACENGKCVKSKNTCDGIDHCGDGSDEICCKGCRAGAFHCKSNMCISHLAHNDGVPDCLDEDDEDEDDEKEKKDPDLPPRTKPIPAPTSTPHPTTLAPAPTTNPTTTTPIPTTKAILTDDYLGPLQCLKQKFTQRLCLKAFCPPWMRCVDGRCVCKVPYMCKRLGQGACGHNGRGYFNHCQAMAASCRSKTKVFSHFGDQCSADNVFSTSLKTDKQVVEVFLPNISKSALVCAKDWDMAAANVVCRDTRSEKARSAASVVFSEVEGAGLPNVCVRMQCTGHEYSLAECNIYGDMKPLTPNDHVASVQCGTDDADVSDCEFTCANGQCVELNDTCDGINHCEDGSDEMCCKACRRNAFHCKSNVCIPPHTVGDRIRDCLGGDDEVPELVEQFRKRDQYTEEAISVSETEVAEGFLKGEQYTEQAISVPKTEVEIQRTSLEVLECGIPNMDYTPPPSDFGGTRTKRVVGGQETTPTQIQWQVAIQEDGKVNCGGAYLGGCWVLTAAHCVGSKPEAYLVKFSLWQKMSRIDTTDIAYVKKLHVHWDYEAQSYRNDIALVELKPLGGSTQCVRSNPAIRSVCVPWSVQQFQPRHDCTISGWGRDKEGKSQNKLQWASVELIDNCENYYPNRFKAGMMCAGDVDGHVDSCQGDSGGPLVCKDPSGVSYVWGVVSWGQECGKKGFPGVYTQVAHYYNWIHMTTDKYITKYNQ